MRFGAGAFLLVSALGAQVMPAPEPVTRGVVLEADPEAAGGEFSIRLDNYEVLRYRFDSRTSVERDNYPLDVPRLHPGERVEVQSVAAAGSLVRYAEAVRSLEQSPGLQALHLFVGRVSDLPCLAPGRSETCPMEDDPLFRRGNLTFSGVIARLNAGGLVLRTRVGERTILLRGDTRYFDNGAIATPAALQPNMRVFVRAGRTLYDELEGYQVVWGQILEPK